jgi:hypothetical protein
MNGRGRAAVAVLLGAVAAVGLTASADANRAPQHYLQASAVAIPSAGSPSDVATETRVDSTWSRTARIAGTATASVTCDGCDGHAVTVQVVSADRAKRLTVRNVAAAWAADCTGCDGSAVTVQVVMARSARAVEAANRALALNAGCTDCHTAAAAVQLVVVSRHGRLPSAATLAELRRLGEQLLDQLRAGDTAPVPTVRTNAARVASTDAASQMSEVLSARMPGATVQPDVKTAADGK